MNKCLFLGRLCADPETRVTTGSNPMTVTRFRLAVNRRFKREGEPDADFLGCVSFGKMAEIIEKYFRKGSLISIECHVQTGSYKNKDGATVYTTDFIIDDFDFVERKSAAQGENAQANSDDFVQVREDDPDLPFN